MGSDRLVPVTGGRQMQVREYGDPRGVAVVALHGTPASRLMFGAADADARRLGLRLLAPDRWGYGGTKMAPNPTLSAFADDIAALADALGIERFAVLGVSGGGPYATAVAARLGKRINAAALVSPVGPITRVPRADMGLFHRFCFTMLPRREGAVRAIFSGYHWLLARNKRLAIGIVTARAPTADRKLIADPAVSDRLLAAFIEGMRDGPAGAVLDMRLFSSPWDVDPGQIVAPTRVWIGDADTNVPVPAAVLLAKLIPDAELTRLAAGHLWVATNYASVLAWVEKFAGAKTSTPEG